MWSSLAQRIYYSEFIFSEGSVESRCEQKWLKKTQSEKLLKVRISTRRGSSWRLGVRENSEGERGFLEDVGTQSGSRSRAMGPTRRTTHRTTSPVCRMSAKSLPSENVKRPEGRRTCVKISEIGVHFCRWIGWEGSRQPANGPIWLGELRNW